MKCLNCPIQEQTADGTTCGRCWMSLTGTVCPRHGDVAKEVARYEKFGLTTLENDMRLRKGMPLLGMSR